MPTLQLTMLRRTSLFGFQGAWELGRVFGCELFCFCLFVCFTTPKVGDYFVSKSHKWVRFSFFVCFVLCCFSFKVFDFPTTYLGSGWFFFLICLVLFFVFFLSRRLVKFFAFFRFCLFLFYFVLFFVFASENSTPLDIKWCALILILLHKWWWTLRHRQFWTPVQFSEKSNSNLKLH